MSDFATKYPEHEKLHAVKDETQAIGEFIEWLHAVKGFWICERHVHVPECYRDKEWPNHPSCGMSSEDFYMTQTPIQRLLAERYDIDTVKLEEEKVAMLEEIRNAHTAEKKGD